MDMLSLEIVMTAYHLGRARKIFWCEESRAVAAADGAVKALAPEPAGVESPAVKRFYLWGKVAIAVLGHESPPSSGIKETPSKS